MPWAVCWAMPAKRTIIGIMKLPPPTPIIPEMKPVRAPRRSRTIHRIQTGDDPSVIFGMKGFRINSTATKRRKKPKYRLSVNSGRKQQYFAPCRTVRSAMPASNAAAVKSTEP
ncbi:MAG: hypothetical protein ACD_87C00264G0001 [uncultured bacterium]|nr:MAG: hypothetical protein ACD_87C00264G0001 [uncultured bacterium]